MSSTSKRKMLIIGPAPLSIGGVAIHIRRLANLLKDDLDITYVDEGRERFDGFFNLRSLNLYKYLKLVFAADVVYINSGVPILRIFHILICKLLLRKTTVVTIHHDVTRERIVSLTKFFVKRCDTLMVVNETTKEIFTGVVKKLIYLSAFIPPDIKLETELPNDITNWCKKCREDKDAVLMVSNAWNLVLYDGCDLYGLDLCLEAMNMLLNEQAKKNFYLIFVVASNTSNLALIEEYKNFVINNGLQNNVLIWESGLSFIRLINEADIVLRTTNTDGEALTIREAISLGKKIIASDVIPRPEGTFLFKNRDFKSLADAIVRASVSDAFSNHKNLSIDYYKKFYLEIFNN